MGGTRNGAAGALPGWGRGREGQGLPGCRDGSGCPAPRAQDRRKGASGRDAAPPSGCCERGRPAGRSAPIEGAQGPAASGRRRFSRAKPSGEARRAQGCRDYPRSAAWTRDPSFHHWLTKARVFSRESIRAFRACFLRKREGSRGGVSRCGCRFAAAYSSFRLSLMAWKDSLEITCSMRQASSAATSGSTPRPVRNRVR